jgi:TPR repeat protein
VIPYSYRHFAAVLLFVFAAVAPTRADDTYIAPVEDAVTLAQRQYAEGRFGEAFGNFYWAAIRDHAQAQEIVGIMYLLGPAVFGPAVRADRDESRFWLSEAAKRGRDVARNSRCAVEQAGKQVLAAALVRDCLRGNAASVRSG